MKLFVLVASMLIATSSFAADLRSQLLEYPWCTVYKLQESDKNQTLERAVFQAEGNGQSTFRYIVAEDKLSDVYAYIDYTWALEDDQLTLNYGEGQVATGTLSFELRGNYKFAVLTLAEGQKLSLFACR